MLLIGIGGALGALARFELGRFLTKRANSTFPWGTFLINISGACLLGLLVGIDISNRIFLFLGEGFLGAYTTFSTFMYEGFHLFESREKNAFIYIGVSLFLGIIGYLAGFEIAQLLN